MTGSSSPAIAPNWNSFDVRSGHQEPAREVAVWGVDPESQRPFLEVNA